MTCKDCVHYEVCLPNSQAFGFKMKTCSKFKSKADFVKIPCKCKECEHFNNYNPDRTYCEEHSDGWGDNIVYVDKNDYCSFGIRKEGADNG